ncbi:ParB N-terminal domain-containing protein [Bacillus thuringiensis]|uniref:ParB N-terminal domain-containing protein n=1 Tax=Bacillus thuringiensis TaxID=1428 RepID=UPI003CF653C5
MSTVNIDEIKIKSTRYQKLDDDMVQQLKASIEEIGLKNPIIITEDKTLVSGLHRLTAMRQLGHTEVPVIYTTKNEYKNNIEEIDENLVRQVLTFAEKAEQSVRKAMLMIKEAKNIPSINSDEIKVYLDDRATIYSILSRLKIKNEEFIDYKQVVLNIDQDVLLFMKKIESERKIPIHKNTYLTISKLPKEWQYKYINELGEKNPNTAAQNLSLQYNNYVTEVRVLEAKRKAESEARKREEERLRKVEEERKRMEELYRKQEEERRQREEEAECKRQELMVRMKKAREEEERLALIRRQEEFERQERFRREEAIQRAAAERKRLEDLREKQEVERQRIVEEERKRQEQEQERKRLEEYYKLHNTTPPALKKSESKDILIGDIIKQRESNPQEHYKVLHFKDTFTVYTIAEKVERREWIDSIEDLQRVASTINKYKNALFICYKKSDMLRIIEEVEKCVKIKQQEETSA